MKAIYKGLSVSPYVREFCIYHTLKGGGFEYGIYIHKHLLHQLRFKYPEEIPNKQALLTFIDKVKKSTVNAYEIYGPPLLRTGWTKKRLNTLVQLIALYKYIEIYGKAMNIPISSAKSDLQLQMRGQF